MNAETNDAAEVEWNAVCRKRMKATVVDGMTEMELVEKLKQEVRVYEWGLALYKMDAASRLSHSNKVLWG